MTKDYEEERREAIEAGNDALSALREALSALESAKNWGIFDIIGGGAISSLIKHGRMEKAQQYIHEAQSSLRHFEDELQDLGNLESIRLDTRDFVGFADVIFDDIFSDIAMQSRIHDAHAKLNEAIRRVEEILQVL